MRGFLSNMYLSPLVQHSSSETRIPSLLCAVDEIPIIWRRNTGRFTHLASQRYESQTEQSKFLGYLRLLFVVPV